MVIDRKTVIAILREAGSKGLKRRDIASRLKLRGAETRELRDLLEELQQEGLIVQARRRRFQLSEASGIQHGILVGYGSRCGLLVTSGKSIGVSSADGFGTAASGDSVLARLKSSDSSCKEINIIRVLRRSGGYVLGMISEHDPNHMIVIHPQKGSRWVCNESEGISRPGEYVIARVERWSSQYDRPTGKITEVLGEKFSAGEDYANILREFNLPAGFLIPAEDEVRNIQADIPEQERKGRLDLTDMLTFTIDPADAKDFDDAISVEKIAGGKSRIGVHIADVDYYVREGSWIDYEALARGRSVYLVDRAIPMLPQKISGELAALRPKEMKPAISVLIDLDQKGQVTSYQIHRSLIRSRKRLTYEDAQDLIDSKMPVRRLDKDLKMIREALKRANEIANILREKRISRGAIDLEIPEIQVTLDKLGRVTALNAARRLDSHNLIEELMILANETVANHMSDLGRLFIYRVHEVPSEEDMNDLSRFAGAMGYRFRWKKGTSAGTLKALLDRVKGRPEQYIISMFLLRSLKKARYSERNIGHFGLASDCYTHFTSPIRRYPDLVVHRLLKRYGMDRLRIDAVNQRGIGKFIRQVCEISSIREIEGDEAERASIKSRVAEYLAGHIGEDFWGTITGVTEFGFFVMLEDTLAEGLVHVSNLSDDYYQVDPNRTMLIGSRRGRIFRVGDRLLVTVAKVDRGRREVDFVPVEFGLKNASWGNHSRSRIRSTSLSVVSKKSEKAKRSARGSSDSLNRRLHKRS
ncbi:MAG: ribonuclease R [bacterium]